MKSTMKLKRLKDADKVSETLKGSMFFLRSTQILQKVFLSASALHTWLSPDLKALFRTTILDKIYWNNEKIYNSNEPPPFTPDSMLLDVFQLQDANQHCFGGKRGRWKYEDEKN